MAHFISSFGPLCPPLNVRTSKSELSETSVIHQINWCSERGVKTYVNSVRISSQLGPGWSVLFLANRIEPVISILGFCWSFFLSLFFLYKQNSEILRDDETEPVDCWRAFLWTIIFFHCSTMWHDVTSMCTTNRKGAIFKIGNECESVREKKYERLPQRTRRTEFYCWADLLPCRRRWTL